MEPDEAPHIILFPEIPFDESDFLARVKATVERVGWCTVVVSEGVKNTDGKFLSEVGTVDAFGHSQLGGAAPLVAGLVKKHLGYKYHWALPDYLQRSARHIASKTDVEHAYAVGKAAVEYALAGTNAVMPVITRTSDQPYRWKIEPAPLAKVANHEKKLPKSYIRRDGLWHHRRRAALSRAADSWRGQSAVCRNGLPAYVRLKNLAVKKKLPGYSISDS